MPTVKGSRPATLKVVKHKPLERIVRIVLVLGVSVAAGIGGFWYGYVTGAKSLGEQRSRDMVAHLEQTLSAVRSEKAELEQRVVNADMGAEVDRKANENIRQEVIQLKEQLAQDLGTKLPPPGTRA